MVLVPADMGVTAPPAEIDAVVLPTFQAPPGDKSVNATGPPKQTTAGPVIVPADGERFIVSTCEATAVPQLFVTE